jgi:hypothetical protein
LFLAKKKITLIKWEYKFIMLKKNLSSRALWLTPVVPATQEAEIRRIAVQSQPGQKEHKTL